MKQIFLGLLMALPITAIAQFSLFGVWSAHNHWIHPKEYLKVDRVAHAGAGFAVSSIVTAVAYSVYEGDKRTNAAITGVMAAFAVGFVKEYIDDQQPDNHWSEEDFWATVHGGILGALTVNITYNMAAKDGTVPVYKTRKYSLFGKKETRELAMKY